MGSNPWVANAGGGAWLPGAGKLLPCTASIVAAPKHAFATPTCWPCIRAASMKHLQVDRKDYPRALRQFVFCVGCRRPIPEVGGWDN